MCGIFGHVRSGDWARRAHRAALDSLQHRGPDQAAEWADEYVHIGHRRLSILDLSERARQPMVSEDGVVVVAVNGEIYNFEALRRELSPTHHFRTTSDSEVLLHGYRAWGIDELLARIEGMYAFSIYDATRKRLFLARDRVGIKPLYYSTRGQLLSWASELKALETFLGTGLLEQDLTALYDFLTYLYVPTPKTLYKGVYKLEPAHYLEVDAANGFVRKQRYWQLPVGGCSDPVDVAADRVRELVGQAVRQQLCSDVPIGFFLSGGVDSSVVVCEGARHCHPANTYCIGLEDDRYDETAFAQLVADSMGTHHRTRIFERSQVAGGFNRLKEWFDEPFADTSAFPSYLVSKFARETCKVVLTGDGGDEVFGGYEWYWQFRRHVTSKSFAPRRLLPALTHIRRRFRDSVAGKIANKLELGMLNELELHTRLLGGLLTESKSHYAALFEIPRDYDTYWHFRRHYRPELPVVTRLQYLDFHTYLPDDILTKVDRVSMSVALEARVPLLATPLVEYVFSLQESIRLHGDRGKGLLKHAYAGKLPAAVLNRNKRGFSIPAKSYLGGIVGAGRSKQEFILQEFFGKSLHAA